MVGMFAVCSTCRPVCHSSSRLLWLQLSPHDTGSRPAPHGWTQPRCRLHAARSSMWTPVLQVFTRGPPETASILTCLKWNSHLLSFYDYVIIIYNKTVCHQCKGLYLELTESVLTERLVLVFILDFDLGKPSKKKNKISDIVTIRF